VGSVPYFNCPRDPSSRPWNHLSEPVFEISETSWDWGYHNGKGDGQRKRSHELSRHSLCTNQQEEPVITGTAEVLSPLEKIRRKRVKIPSVENLSEKLFKEVLKGGRI